MTPAQKAGFVIGKKYDRIATLRDDYEAPFIFDEDDGSQLPWFIDANDVRCCVDITTLKHVEDHILTKEHVLQVFKLISDRLSVDVQVGTIVEYSELLAEWFTSDKVLKVLKRPWQGDRLYMNCPKDAYTLTEKPETFKVKLGLFTYGSSQIYENWEIYESDKSFVRWLTDVIEFEKS
jgi:hypothetical protein